MADIDFTISESLYSIYRDYVKHEDALINNRMTLFMTIQSLLIGAFSLLVSAISWVVINTDKYGEYTVYTILFLTIVVLSICAIGLSSSVSTAKSVKAATSAITQLRTDYDLLPEAERSRFPGLTGGGKADLLDDGFFQPGDFLNSVKGFWCFLGAVCLTSGLAVAGSIKIPAAKPVASKAEEVGMSDGLKLQVVRQALAGCTPKKGGNSDCMR